MKAKELFMLMSAAQILAGDERLWNNAPSHKNYTTEDLKPEYDLIMAKKSKLTANERRVIVRQYERLINLQGREGVK
jgi:hypothetical protein